MAFVAVLALFVALWVAWRTLSSDSAEDSDVTPASPLNPSRQKDPYLEAPGHQSQDSRSTSSVENVATTTTDDSRVGPTPIAIRKGGQPRFPDIEPSNKVPDASAYQPDTTADAEPDERKALLARKRHVTEEYERRREAAEADLQIVLEEQLKQRQFHKQLEQSLAECIKSLNAASALLQRRRARNLLRPDDPTNDEGPPPEAVEAHDRLQKEYAAKLQQRDKSSETLLRLGIDAENARTHLMDTIRAADHELHSINAHLDKIDAKRREAEKAKKRAKPIAPALRPANDPAAPTPPQLSTDPPRTVSPVPSSMKDVVRRRRIKGLIHFTRIENLGTIARDGLLSRAEVERRKMVVTRNDDLRLDLRLDHISLSISWPNWQLFYRFRMQSGMGERHWCILVIDPSVLWTLPCIFTTENAASSAESHSRDSERATVQAFERLFTDEGAQRLRLTRDQLALEDHFPTNHQAEVLVKCQVPFDRIRRIVVADEAGKQLAMHILPPSSHALLKVNKDPFQPRADWRHWVEARKVVENDGSGTKWASTSGLLDVDDNPL